MRVKNQIIIPGEPFELLTKAEINALITRGVFRFIKYDEKKHRNTRIFKSRIINEVKGKTTEALYKKSRLVV